MLSTAPLSTEKVLSLKFVPPERQRFATRQGGVAKSLISNETLYLLPHNRQHGVEGKDA